MGLAPRGYRRKFTNVGATRAATQERRVDPKPPLEVGLTWSLPYQIWPMPVGRGQVRPEVGQALGQKCSILSKVARPKPKVDQTWPNSGHLWPESGRMQFSSDQYRPDLTVRSTAKAYTHPAPRRKTASNQSCIGGPGAQSPIRNAVPTGASPSPSQGLCRNPGQPLLSQMRPSGRRPGPLMADAPIVVGVCGRRADSDPRRCNRQSALQGART